MRAWVSQLYKAGKPLPHGKKLDVFEGELDVSDHLHPILKRLVKEANLVNQDGLQVIDPMIDVQLVGVYGTGLRLRGIECIGGREHAQEWWVRVHE